MTPAQACERIRLEFGPVIEQIAKLAQGNPEIAQNMYAHLEAALEARVFRLCQLSERHGFRLGLRAAQSRRPMPTQGAAS